MNMRVNIPRLGWSPRDHQMPLWNYLHDGGKRAIAVWHRRAGKDEIACITPRQRVQQASATTGTACRSTRRAARRSGPRSIRTPAGAASTRRFRTSCARARNDHEMFIRLINGSTLQCIGTDQYYAARSAHRRPAWCSPSTRSSNPSAWAYIRPMLEENNGWASFITTPRGRNHALDMYNYARARDGWFCRAAAGRATLAR